MRDFFRTLTGRAVLVTAATAVVAVIVTALVAVPVAVRSVNLQIRAELMDKTVLAVESLTDERPAARKRITDRLRAQDIEIYLIRNGRVDRDGLPPRVVRRVLAGETVDIRAQVGGRPSFIAGGPLPGAASGVVLTRGVASGIWFRVLGGVWVALLAGLLGGILAGALLARFVVRPIGLAAAAAGRLSAGDRSVRIVRAGPVEAVRLADAFNQLAAALQTSEGRERDFLLSVSHELRTPLATIRGYAEALADGVIAGGDTAAAGSTVLAEAQRLDRLISDLLVLSRLEAADLPLDVTEVDLAELVRQAGQAWAARCADGGPALTVETPDGPVTVGTDPGRIRQVLDGLCENALRVVPAGAPLVLAVRAGEAAGIIEVRDGGPGFTDDDLAVAFERGELNRRYRGVRKVGSGLGLALAARLVTRLGGRITAGHAPEGGAMFTVELPYRSVGSRPLSEL
jgi:signal transduction histidine kinase